MSEYDIGRRNSFASLLSDWGLVSVLGQLEPIAPLSQIKIIAFKEKNDWTLETKYNIGKSKDSSDGNTTKSILR